MVNTYTKGQTSMKTNSTFLVLLKLMMTYLKP